MKVLILLFVLTVVTDFTKASDAAVYSQEFHNFVTKFGKSYKDKDEIDKRFNIFKENLKQINIHNSQNLSYRKGINKFSDLTDSEFSSRYLGGYKSVATTPSSYIDDFKLNKELPESVDWCSQGACTPTKDQGSCGSCWAFAATEVIESHVFLSTGTLPILSPQQMNSCTPNPLSCGGTGGCAGSICELGFAYIQLFGMVSEEDYPYVSGDSMQTEDCMYDLNNMPAVAGVTGYNTLPSNNQEALMEVVATVGPVTVAVDASNWSGYREGVFDGCDFDQNIGLNHAVVLVGYGTDEADGDYWLVRNSWGSGWGEDGYIKLKRQNEAQCGVNNTPEGGACPGGPGNDPQKVCGQCGILYTSSIPLGAHLIQQ